MMVKASPKQKFPRGMRAVVAKASPRKSCALCEFTLFARQVIECIYVGLMTGKLDQKGQRLEVHTLWGPGRIAVPETEGPHLLESRCPRPGRTATLRFVFILAFVTHAHIYSCGPMCPVALSCRKQRGCIS